MGQHFDDYSGFQPKTTPLQRYATQCTYIMIPKFPNILTNRLGGREAWRPTHFHNTRLFLHFPNELCYGYLRFEGNGKIPLGR
jgi:hypothetical protein